MAWARFYLARVYIDIGRPDKAKEELLAALKTRPGTGHFISLLGEAERKLGNLQTAVDLQAQALKADPALSPAHYYAALAYMDMKNDDAAVAELEAAIRSPHVAPDMYLTLGSIYARRKRYKEAEDLCLKGIALDPSRSEGYLNMAQLQNAQGRGEKALTALRKAMPDGKSFPTSPYYQKLQADIHMEFGRAWESRGQPDKALQSYLSCVGLDSARDLKPTPGWRRSIRAGATPRAPASTLLLRRSRRLGSRARPRIGFVDGQYAAGGNVLQLLLPAARPFDLDYSRHLGRAESNVEA